MVSFESLSESFVSNLYLILKTLLQFNFKLLKKNIQDELDKCRTEITLSFLKNGFNLAQIENQVKFEKKMYE
jgi:hypothetical protein